MLSRDSLQQINILKSVTCCLYISSKLCVNTHKWRQIGSNKMMQTALRSTQNHDNIVIVSGMKICYRNALTLMGFSSAYLLEQPQNDKQSGNQLAWSGAFNSMKHSCSHSQLKKNLVCLQRYPCVARWITSAPFPILCLSLQITEWLCVILSPTLLIQHIMAPIYDPGSFSPVNYRISHKASTPLLPPMAAQQQ